MSFERKNPLKMKVNLLKAKIYKRVLNHKFVLEP